MAMDGKQILIVNLHSSHNAGDGALTQEALRLLAHHFDRPRIMLAMNDPGSHQGPEQVAGAFYTWLRKETSDGRSRWRLGAIPRLLLIAVIAGLVWRIRGRLPRLGLNEAQYRLLQMYTRADVIASCAGNVFYSSGRVGFPFMLAAFTIGYGWLLGKPLYTLPQSFGPLNHWWEKRLLRWLAGRIRLMLVREPRSMALLEAIGVDRARRRLVPDIAFSYRERDDAAAEALLRSELGAAYGRVPLLGITMMNWAAQNFRFQGQAAYETAVRTAIEAFIEQTDGHVFLFSQVWGPTASEDDRVPARRVAAPLAASGRVHLVDRELNPATLKSCYGRMALLVGTRMHSNIFALSEETPVLAIGYRTKTWGIMEMLGLEAWIIDIHDITAERFTARLLDAWQTRERLRQQVAARLPAIKQQAITSIGLIASDLAGGDRPGATADGTTH